MKSTSIKLNEIAVAGSLYGAVGQAVRWCGVGRTEIYLETPSPQLAYDFPVAFMAVRRGLDSGAYPGRADPEAWGDIEVLLRESWGW